MITNLKARGTKRICQSEDCGLPFYDLNRTEISCPSCGTALPYWWLACPVDNTRRPEAE